MEFSEKNLNGYILRECKINKDEFLAMSKNEKINCLAHRYRYHGVRYIARLEDFANYDFVRMFDENTAIIRNPSYKKFLINLDTCEATPFSQSEFNAIIEREKYDLGILEKKKQELLKELAKVEAKIAMFENK